MSLVDVQGHDLLKQLVEHLVGVGHYQCALVQVGDDLDRHVGLAGAGRPDHHGQAGVALRDVLGVWAPVDGQEGFHGQDSRTVYHVVTARLVVFDV